MNDEIKRDALREQLLGIVMAKVTELAARELPADGTAFNACECSGGNYDDAYRLGLDAGETYLAREIRDALSEPLAADKEHTCSGPEWWCCKADYPNHEPTCRNYQPPAEGKEEPK